MDKTEMLKLAAWIKHMYEQGSQLAHIPEMREHLNNLEKWERGIRSLAQQTQGSVT